jgi:hypothetical protein
MRVSLIDPLSLRERARERGLCRLDGVSLTPTLSQRERE